MGSQTQSSWFSCPSSCTFFFLIKKKGEISLNPRKYQKVHLRCPIWKVIKTFMAICKSKRSLARLWAALFKDLEMTENQCIQRILENSIIWVTMSPRNVTKRRFSPNQNPWHFSRRRGLPLFLLPLGKNTRLDWQAIIEHRTTNYKGPFGILSNSELRSSCTEIVQYMSNCFAEFDNSTTILF